MCKKASYPVAGILVLLAVIGFCARAPAQTVYVVDQFLPSGVDGNNYANGQITNVWGNWFGNAFSNLVWDSTTSDTNDAGNNPTAGAMKIIANFNGQGSIPNQFEVYDGFNGIIPALNGRQYTNFQCDVRFAAGSATSGGNFPTLQFGTAVGNTGQDYFSTSVTVSSGNTNWVHVSIPISATSDTNLLQINDVLIHMYESSSIGEVTFWVDNIEFVGASPVTTNCVVNWNNVYQRIDGFGASSAWDSSMSTAQADIFFSTNNGIIYTDDLGNTSTNNGIGLSLLRSRIAPGGTTVEGSIMQMAQSLGAKVWSTPWSPAAQFKSNGNVDGGSFVGTPANYQAYANQQAGYVANMQSQYGVSLYAISVQNEPDAQVTTYESCNWNAAQIAAFVPYLYNALAASNVASTVIMLPESQNWQDYSNLAVATMTNASTATDVGIIADHNYDGVNGPATLTKNSYGKALWETEVSLLSGSDSSIDNGVYYAQRIFLFMTQAQVNAWHYWWLVSGAAGNEGLMDNSAAITKRLFTVGNYSRFVRPGYYRIGVSNNSFASISAYQNTNSGNFAIVAVNSDPTTVTQIFDLTNFPTFSSVTPWVTSSNLSLANQSPVAVSGQFFSYPLPAMSVVTFVGQATNITPTFVPISNQTINAGVTLSVTNTVVDPNVPPLTLTFGLLSAPTNATLNSASGIFTWQPSVSQANTTNLITVTVTDNGNPSLSATNSFNVIVNPITPTLAPIPDQTIGAGVTLVLTNVATAADVPPQTLTFSLLNAPENATLDPVSGIFTWRPPVSQANTTNLIATSVTDNDSANMSATDSFNVIVNPLAQPVISSINTSSGQVSLVVNGPAGPDYTLLSSTNLTNWQVLFTTNSPVTPITLIDTNFGADSACFYLIQIGP
jgi:glucuronoarabinoxylan endo-1,4-beta-xylanase